MLRTIEGLFSPVKATARRRTRPFSAALMRRTDHYFSCCFNVLSASSPPSAADELTQCGRRTTASVRYFFVPAASGKRLRCPTHAGIFGVPQRAPRLSVFPTRVEQRPTARASMAGSSPPLQLLPTMPIRPDQSNAHPPFPARTMTRQEAPNHPGRRVSPHDDAARL